MRNSSEKLDPPERMSKFTIGGRKHEPLPADVAEL